MYDVCSNEARHRSSGGKLKMKIYHIERDTNKSLNEQKKEIMKQYKNVVLIQSDGRKVTIFAD